MLNNAGHKRGMPLQALVAAASIVAALGAPLPGGGELRAAQFEAGVEASYVAVKVVTPTNDQTVHDNLGKVEVRVAVAPALQTGRGHRLQIILDDRPVAATTGDSHVLNGVERGTHTLRAAVIDRDGRELAASEPVTFYLWQASRLFPKR